jgi:hypothetical protein
MTPNPGISDIQQGWKVYARSEEVGRVVDVAREHIDVGHGLLRRHLYRIPRVHVAEASGGIVDLDMDLEDFEELEVDL